MHTPDSAAPSEQPHVYTVGGGDATAEAAAAAEMGWAATDSTQRRHAEMRFNSDDSDSDDGLILSSRGRQRARRHGGLTADEDDAADDYAGLYF